MRRHHRAYILVAATLLLVGSSAEAATISFSPVEVNFGDVTIGTTDTIEVVATVTPDAPEFAKPSPAPDYSAAIPFCSSGALYGSPRAPSDGGGDCLRGRDDGRSFSRMVWNIT